MEHKPSAHPLSSEGRLDVSLGLVSTCNMVVTAGTVCLSVFLRQHSSALLCFAWLVFWVVFLGELRGKKQPKLLLLEVPCERASYYVTEMWAPRNRLEPRSYRCTAWLGIDRVGLIEQLNEKGLSMALSKAYGSVSFSAQEGMRTIGQGQRP